MADCPSDMSIFSNEPSMFVNWTAPSFHDPVGKSIEVTTNYPDNSWTFPWGDFVAQYVALKPSNGLRRACTFNISIRRTYRCNFTRVYDQLIRMNFDIHNFVFIFI
jgi:hypothetical protein